VKDRNADELFECLNRHDVPVAPVVPPSELAALPQFATRSKFEAGDHMPLVRFPVPLAGVNEAALGPVPALGSARV
jgi:crotonobetainyl-CoA:carnitine CoA-transferase CaiB-like acyl-CoA transferase